jgi:hypothetical protein
MLKALQKEDKEKYSATINDLKCCDFALKMTWQIDHTHFLPRRSLIPWPLEDPKPLKPDELHILDKCLDSYSVNAAGSNLLDAVCTSKSNFDPIHRLWDDEVQGNRDAGIWGRCLN